MRTHHIIFGLALAIIGAQAASGQEYRGTSAQQMACTPDVWRLCGDQIPDVSRIVACLQRNMPNLSGGCRAVFESDSHVAARPGRLPPPPPPGYFDDDDDY
jgi:hypothetical protein